MDASQDIYHKDDEPFLFRRKKKRAQGSGLPAMSSGDPSRNERKSDVGISPIDGRSQIYTHRRRRVHPYTVTPWAWVGILAVVMLYYLALGVTKIKKPFKPKAPAVRTAVQAPVEVPTNEPALVDRGKSVVDEIRNWKQSQRLVTDAQGFIRDGRSDDAAKSLERALTADPASREALIALGTLQLQAKNYSKACDMFMKALSADPDDVPTRLLLARACVGARVYEAAVVAANWAIDGDRFDVEAHQVAATAQIAMGHHDKAIDYLKKVVTLDEENLAAYNQLADAYSKTGNHGEAIEVLKKLIQRDTGNSASYFTLAVCYARNLQVEPAIEVLGDAASRFGPGFVSTWTTGQEFDGIRTNAQFGTFQAQLADGTLTTSPIPTTNPPTADEALTPAS